MENSSMMAHHKPTPKTTDGTIHSHEVDSTTEWISAIMRKCAVCLRRTIYSKRTFYCKLCNRYAHKRCLEILSTKSEPRVRFADTESEEDRNTRTTAGGSRENSNTALAIPNQLLNVAHDVRLDSVPETRQASAVRYHSSCVHCGRFNKLKTLEIELEKIKFLNTPAFGKNEFRHKNVRITPGLDQLAYTNTHMTVKLSQGLRNCLEVENNDFLTNATRTAVNWHVKPIVIAVARTGRAATSARDDEKWTARGDRCTAVAVIERRLPGDEAPTNVIFVDRSGYEWAVVHERALEIAGIPARCSRFLSRTMEETIRDRTDRNATTVVRHAEKAPAEFTVMRTKTSYIASSARSPFFRIRVDAFETSLERTAHDYFVMAYDRRGDTIRAELFDLPGTSDVFRRVSR